MVQFFRAHAKADVALFLPCETVETQVIKGFDPFDKVTIDNRDKGSFPSSLECSSRKAHVILRLHPSSRASPTICALIDLISVRDFR